MNDFRTKLAALAAKVEAETIERLHADNLACEANVRNAKVTVIDGTKYVKVNVGGRGSLMVEKEDGAIYGIKGYGKIHKGHRYGTLDTIDEWYWGKYYPYRIALPALAA